ncbi:MAG: serine/threonine protein kinase [Symploca sp. SIO2D2]|nr:serine/threonine protein kinase [Symploca sp. SIO2D2]
MIWPAGKKLHQGKYIILGEPLGQGGFGITYKAEHVELKEIVVIKTPIDYRQIELLEEEQYWEYVEHFVKEGKKLAKLSQKAHPNIVRVRDVFQEGTIPCLVMDFVPGKNLFKLVKERGRLPKTIAVGCIRQIGDALATMHEMGLVHRDAHPGNIILRDDGRAILIDFGIAKELFPSTQTITGKAGHEIFAPYEQLSGKGSRKPNVDVYCLAATLYYTVTGKCPIASRDRKLGDVPLPPPQQLVPSISQHLSRAIMKGMALEEKNRPQSMQQWLHEIELIANTPKQVSRRIQMNSSVLKKCKNNTNYCATSVAATFTKISTDTKAFVRLLTQN